MDPRAAAGALGARLGRPPPRVLVVLGSGLGGLAEELAAAEQLGFDELGLRLPGAAGHAGRFVAGWLEQTPVLAQLGRCHLYEGATPAEVVAPVRAAAAAGIGELVITNAAGGLRSDLRPGQLVCLRDQLNLTGASPLAGETPPQFVDMASAYDPGRRAAAAEAAAALDEPLAEGVYAGVLGPAYETPAEARMLRALGADLVGMSTVLEVIAARAAGMRVLGLSLVTNAHGAATPVSHSEVLAAAQDGAPRLLRLLRAVLGELA